MYDCSELRESPAVDDYSEVGDSAEEQVRFGLPLEHFGQLGHRLVQLLQYSTNTEVEG